MSDTSHLTVAEINILTRLVGDSITDSQTEDQNQKLLILLEKLLFFLDDEARRRQAPEWAN
jgi:hypothetical protein